MAGGVISIFIRFALENAFNETSVIESGNVIVVNACVPAKQLDPIIETP